ncbi:hypothetical protein CI102_13178 [Trichoderma harzianum]|nr:hypothetical protein CI102_13178 [Trichoderma harzianum]
MRNGHASCIPGHHQQILLALCRSFSKFCVTAAVFFPPSIEYHLQLVSLHAPRLLCCRDTKRTPGEYPASSLYIAIPNSAGGDPQLAQSQPLHNSESAPGRICHSLFRIQISAIFFFDAVLLYFVTPPLFDLFAPLPLAIS